MDSILAIGVGLGLRALIDSVTDTNITASALVGIWEGVVLNHFLLKHRASFDPYVAFGFRLFVDFMFTESFARMTMTVMWAFLGMVFADLGGDLSKDRRFRRIWRRVRHTFPFLDTLSRSRRSSSSRVRFTSGVSSSSSSSTPTPRLPLRPSSAPFPGAFDQWSVASSEIGGPTRSEASVPSRSEASIPSRSAASGLSRSDVSGGSGSVAEPITRDTRTYRPAETRPDPRPEPIRRLSRRAPSVHTIHSDTQRSEPIARSPSELDYLTLPVIPDADPSPIQPRFREQDEQDRLSDRSGLTTPSHDPLLRDLPEDDRPRVHSGLTTPDQGYTNLMQTSEGLPPVRVISDEHEHTPSRSQVELPPIPIRPPGSVDEADPQPTIAFPEPHIPALSDLVDSHSQVQPETTLLPPITEIPNISTPSLFEPDTTSRPNTLVDPPPQYEEPIKEEIPDNRSDGLGAESVISSSSRTGMINRADEFRKLAETQEKAKAGYRIALERARREKRHWDVLWYEGEIEDADLKVKELNAKAAHRYFKAHNLKPEPQTIDIHRLNVHEAIIEVKRALKDARGAGSPELRVITGRGKHSKNNIPVLKKAIIQKLLEYEIDAKGEPGNPGVLVIAIPQLTLAGSSTSI
ncbi:hypothetical protein EIP91_011583 [Steccherinum ochraceum]|uniref:Smr domain-containing protein n=1 Tax=Steccherinum ochraceum TaxID=92696 RepID=A0A4R0RRG8_9APHY|nr:hypothetical protein EIP91_011583 [Steccherinum ochraceum]